MLICLPDKVYWEEAIQFKICWNLSQEDEVVTVKPLLCWWVTSAHKLERVTGNIIFQNDGGKKSVKMLSELNIIDF